jgi:MFS family permease
MNKLRWYDYLSLNSYSLGLSLSSSTITPILLPYLVVLFMPPEEKNTHLATVRVIGLAVAMLVQPLFGMLSDRSTSRYGRRRPFIVGGTLLNILCLLLIGFTPSFMGAEVVAGEATAAFIALIVCIVLMQIGANISMGAYQGLIPDLVPEDQRGRASGVKSIMELLPIILVMFIGPLVDKGRVWTVLGILIAMYALVTVVTVLWVKEQPLKEKPVDSIREPVWRIVALTAIFVGITQAAVWLVGASGGWLNKETTSIGAQVTLVGGMGLLGMAGSIVFGVYFGAWIGVGKEALQRKSFIWWVVNRLLFLAAIGSIQGFAQYYLADVIKVPNPAGQSSMLLMITGAFLLPSAMGAGWLSDRIGRRQLIAISGLVAAGGAALLLLAQTMTLICGAILGLATGTFYAANWALGTDLVPKESAGRYLGISNLAGAGAGIVGAGIGGPLATFFNNNIQAGLGYMVIFGIYALLFLLSTLALRKVK